MIKAENLVGFTDTGQPLVLAESVCDHFIPGKGRLLNRQSCWYCRWADFRKTTEIALAQSVCRCPQNQMTILSGGKNETLEPQGHG